MDGTTGAIARWDVLFPGQPEPRRKQVRTLMELLGPGKAAVDIGVWLGYSAIAMRLTGAEVTGVDSYAPHHGWADEAYNGDADLALFRENCSQAKVFVPIWRLTAVEAGQHWNQGPVDLVHWDLDLGHTMADDFAAWEPNIKPGGWFVFHDLPGQRFGSGLIMKRAIASGKWRAGQAWIDANLWGIVRR